MLVDDFSKRGAIPTFLVVILAVVLILGSTVLGYFLGAGQNDKEKKSVVTTSDIEAISTTDSVVLDNNKQQPDFTTSTSTGLPAAMEGSVFKVRDFSFDLSPYKVIGGDVSADPPIRYMQLPKEVADNINWIGYYAIDNLGFFNVEHNTSTVSEREGLEGNYTAAFGPTTYYIGGYFEHNNKGGLVVFADVTCLDCMGGDEKHSGSMFVLYDNNIILLERYIYPKQATMFSVVENPMEHIVRSRIGVDNELSIKYLDFPKDLYIKPGIVLSYISTGLLGQGNVSLSSVKKFATVDTFGDVLADSNNQYFYILGRDGRQRVYEYIPDVFKNDKLDTVIFNDGKKIEGYRHWSVGGCGRSSIYLLYSGEINLDVDLVEAGKTTTGLKVFKLKDEDHAVQKGFYNLVFFPVEGAQISYEEFVKERPVVFWIDSLNRVVMLQLNKFTPVAECGKPVIYLHPQQDTKVKVSLEVERFSRTEPEYANGWEVLAKPNGELINLSDNKIYPYLFWEGIGVGEQPEAKEGFVVRREEVDNFLREKLSRLGLEGREIDDFVEFWQPRMNKSPYYLVTFFGTNVMNQIAPLTVVPKPDTVIRVLMDYHPLEKPISVNEQRLSHPKRSGFTVVEWGGVLGRE